METQVPTGLTRNPTSPSSADLRKFGVGLGLLFILGLGLAWPLAFQKPLPLWPHFVGAPLVLVGAAFPKRLRPVYVLWMSLGSALGWVNTRILLAIVFFLIFTPLALFFRCTRRDSLELRFDPERESYWRDVEAEARPRFERSF